MSVQGTSLEHQGHPADFEWPSAEVSECPYPFYEALRAEAPVYKHPERNEYLVSRWEDVTYVARHPELFSHRIRDADPNLKRVMRAGQTTPRGKSGRVTTYGMASSDPPEHKVKRTLGLRFVQRERLDAYEPMIRAHADRLIDAWIDRGECDFCAEFADPLPVYVISEILGVPLEDVPLFERWGQTESQGARYLPEERVQLEIELQREADVYMRSAFEQRLVEPRDDFLTELMQAQIEVDGEIDMEYLIAEGKTLLFAGNITTAHMLASTMALLCEHPDSMARVVADPSLLRSMCEESLRVESPLQWHLRVCTQDTEIGGVAIPEGALVAVFYGSGNRDEERFPDADAFMVDRANAGKHQLAFGHGPHLCLGAPLARLEGRIAYEQLLSRLANIRVLPEKSDLSHIESTRFRAPKRVQIAFDRA